MLSGRLMLRWSATQMFLKAVGIDADPIREREAFHLACEAINPRFKDKEGRRQDLVRFQLQDDQTKWDDAVRLATLNLAEKLGMLCGEKILEGDFDIVAALGGANKSPLQRGLYAAEFIERGVAGAKVLAIAGSTRVIKDAEKQVATYAPGAETEYDLCLGAANFLRTRYPDINTVAVCKDDPRSGNDGVIAQVMQEYGDIGEGPVSFAAVTTKIYLTALLVDLARLNKTDYHWAHFAGAGHPTDPEVISGRKIATYLSECATTIDKASWAAQFGC